VNLVSIPALPVIHFGQEAFFVDLKLKQFRQVDNVYNFINFNNDEGKALCKYGNNGLASWIRLRRIDGAPSEPGA
jgi:hypothetical protein